MRLLTPLLTRLRPILQTRQTPSEGHHPSVLDTDNGIRLGLDLVGGSRIVYEAEIPDGYDTNNLSDDMNSVQKVIRQRLTDKGFTELPYPSAARTA